MREPDGSASEGGGAWTPLPRRAAVIVVTALAVPVLAAVPASIAVAAAVLGRSAARATATPPAAPVITAVGVLVAAVLGAAAIGRLPAPDRLRRSAATGLVVLALIDAAVVLLPLLGPAGGSVAALSAANLALTVLVPEVPLILWLLLRGRPRSTWWVLVLPLIAIVLGLAVRGLLTAFGPVAGLVGGSVVFAAVQQAALLGAAALASSLDPRP